MAHLNETGAAERAAQAIPSRLPTLGICLGMQLAVERSEEDGGVEGARPAGGRRGATARRSGAALGWSIVEALGRRLLLRPLLRGALAAREVARVDGVTVAVRPTSFFGVQFHPEKSGPAGLEFLDQCLSLA